MDGIRTIDHTDTTQAEAIHAVLQAAYRVEADVLGVADFVPLRRGVRSIVTADSTFLGESHEGRLVAACEIERTAAGEINVAALVVHPDCFRQGRATRLMRHVLDLAGPRAVTVSTGRANTPAVTLYRRLGFVERSRWETPDGIAMITFVSQPAGDGVARRS